MEIIFYWISFWFFILFCLQYIKHIYEISNDLLQKKQFSYILAQHVIPKPILAKLFNAINFFAIIFFFKNKRFL